MNGYVLLKEIVGGEEEDKPSTEIVAVSTDLLAVANRVPTSEYICVDPEFIEENLEWDYPNQVTRYVIRRFDLASGNEVDDTCTIFWSVADFAANGCTISI